MAYHAYAAASWPAWDVQNNQLVSLPMLHSAEDLLRQITLPDWSVLALPETYLIAATIAIVANLETLLSLEGVDKLDPHKRIAPTNRELKAQGVGNAICGLVGGTAHDRRHRA